MSQSKISSAQDGWGGVFGQNQALETMQAAARNPELLAHAWLLTGPAGSGRSTLAYAFAAELISQGEPQIYEQVIARNHPDLSVLRSEQVTIRIEEIRKLVERSYLGPAVGPYRVIVIEDADRMPQRSSNVLLKALEEPPPQTIWVLCAPSEADLLPTIRSRTRVVRLNEPEVAEVSALLQARFKVSAEEAESAARLAQRHIGMAQRLLSDQSARERRDATVKTVLGVKSVPAAVRAGATLLELAQDDAKILTAQREEQERAQLLATLGATGLKTLPPAVRQQLSQLEEEQKRRATRSLRDAIDRILSDCESLFRDILMLQLERGEALINQEYRAELSELAKAKTPDWALAVLDAISSTRKNMSRNVAALLALESLMLTVARGTRVE